MSACLNGGRSFGLHLDIVKTSSPSSSSSTISELSTSPPRICTKRPRTPRKRPNQRYSEAAALLSTANPRVFSPKSLGKLCKHTRYVNVTSFTDCGPEFVPACPVSTYIGNENSFLRIEHKPVNCSRSGEFCEPVEDVDEGFDTELILDGEVEEGIDSIMGKLNMSNDAENCNPRLMGFGFGLSRADILWAVRHTGYGERWSSPRVAVRDIIPKIKTLSSITSSEKRKNGSKTKKKEKVEESQTTSVVSKENMRPRLLLKLNYDEVAKEWADRGSLFSHVSGGEAPVSSADILARLEDIVPSPEEEGGGGGTRVASMVRYKEKRRSRLYSKKIRYQVRKVNADTRPRMKVGETFVNRNEMDKCYLGLKAKR